MIAKPERRPGENDVTYKINQSTETNRERYVLWRARQAFTFWKKKLRDEGKAKEKVSKEFSVDSKLL